MEEVLRAQEVSPGCFCCGDQNPHGLGLRFTRVDDTVVTRFVPPEHWVGFGRILHGGFQGLLLDEIMSWAVWGLTEERTFVTRSMTVEFHAPVWVGQELEIVGRVTARDGRRLETRGEIRDGLGKTLTTSNGVVVAVDAEKMRAMKDGG